jgi:hypothetical protein
MKLRCSENSIRLRVRKSELKGLKTEHVIEEKVQIGAAVFRFVLRNSKDAVVNASFENGAITLHVPTKELEQWMNSEQVGIEVEQPLEEGGILRLLIEKDFPCETRTKEDKSDTFQELASKNDTVC